MAQESTIASVEPMAAEAPSKTVGDRVSVASLSAAFLVDTSEEQALPILWPHMYSSLGASIGQLGPVLGASKLAMTMMYPIWGYAADRFSRKRLLVWFTGIWGLWTLGISLVDTVPQLLTLRVLSGLGLGVFAPAAFSLISDLFDNRSRGRATGIMRAVGLFGIILAVILLPSLAQRGPEGWRIGFALLGLASFVTGLLMTVIKEPARGASEPELRDVITKERASRFTVTWSDLWDLFKIRSWRYLLLNELLTKSSLAVFTGWNFTYLSTLGLEEPIFYLTVMIVFLGIGSGSIFFGWLGDRLDGRLSSRGRVTMIQIGLIAWPFLVIGYLSASGDNVPWLIAFGFFSGVSYTTASEGTLWPVAQAVLPPELRGSNRAIISMVVGAASALLLAWSGIMADRLGVSAALLWFVPLPVLLAGLAWIPMFRAYPQDRAALHRLLTDRRRELLAQE